MPMMPPGKECFRYNDDNYNIITASQQAPYVQTHVSHYHAYSNPTVSYYNGQPTNQQQQQPQQWMQQPLYAIPTTSP
jgi:hypothetical protein